MLIGGGIGLNRVTAAGDAYGILNGQFRPEFVADFSTDQYRAGGAGVALSDALTFSRAGNATMVDSDGLLKWAPHNLLTYSEDFSNWGETNTTVTANAAVAPDGTMTADAISHTSDTAELYQYVSNILTNGEKYTVGVYAKYVDHQWFRIYHENGSTYFDLVNGVTGTVGANSASITDVGNGWYLCEVNNTHNSSDNTVLTVFMLADGDGSGVETSGTSAYIWGAHLYRSDDLGGMVDNPATGDSYVPTTSAAVYLPRVGHHVYNGSAWVNEGLLLESEARTNTISNSQDLSAAALFISDASGTTTLVDGEDDPNGGTDGALLSGMGGAGTFNDYVAMIGAGSITAGDTLTASVWLKGTAGETVKIRLTRNGAGTFESSDEDVTLTGAWQREYVTHTFANNQDNARFDIGNIVTSNTATSVRYAWPQLEAGSTPSSYIPTTGSTVTRAAETLTAASANLPWPTPKVIGDELVTNGTFDTGDLTGWVELGSPLITFPSGAVNVESTGTNDGIAQQLVGVAAGDVVWLNFNVSGSISYVFQNNSPDFASITNILPAFAIPTGVNELAFVAAHDDPFICFGTASSSGANFTIDNVSVREIDPLAVSIAMEGRVTYADEGAAETVVFHRRVQDGSNLISTFLRTDGAREGDIDFRQVSGGTLDNVIATGAYSPDILVPFNIASRHGSTFVNGAVDGTALTANTTPTALPDLSSTDMQIGYDYMGTISLLRIWADDIGDSGIALGSATAPVITGLPTIGVS